MPGGPPLFPVCPPSARVHPPPAAARTPSRLSDPCARQLSPRHGSVSSAPARPPLRARPLSSSPFSLRARPLSLPFFPFPPPGPAIIRPSIPCARPLRPSPPAPPLLSRPFLQFRAPPLQKNAVRAAGLTRRGRGPGFRACVARFCGLPRAGGDEDGGATVAAGHKTGLPRGRGAGIRRNGRRNRQAGLPRAVGGGGAAPASVPASLDFAVCRAREGRVAAQRSLPP